MLPRHLATGLIALALLALLAPAVPAQLTTATSSVAKRGAPDVPGGRFVVPHLRIGFSSGALTLLARDDLSTVGRIDFQAQEWPVDDVDAVIAGDLALLLTDRASGSAVRAIRISDGTDQGLVTLPANEQVQIGVDPILVHGRLVYLVELSNGSGALRSVDLNPPISAASGFFFDPGERPAMDIEPVLTQDGTLLVFPTDSLVGTGNIYLVDAFALVVVKKFPLMALQELPMTGIDPVLTPDGSTALVPLYDDIQQRGRIRFIDLAAHTSVDVALATAEYPAEDVDVVLSADGQLAFWPVNHSAGIGSLKIFDVDTPSLLGDIPFASANEGLVWAVDPVLTPDGSKLLLPTHTGAGGSGRLRIIDVATLSVDHTITLPTNEWPVEELDLLVTPDSSRVLWQTYEAATSSGFLHIYDIATGQELHQIPFDLGEVPVEGCDLVLDTAGPRVLVTTWDFSELRATLRIVDYVTGATTRRDFLPNEHPVPHVEPLVLNGQRALVVNNDSATAQTVLRLVQLPSGIPLITRTLDFGEASRVGVDVLASWLPDGDPDADSTLVDGAVPPPPKDWPDPPGPPRYSVTSAMR